MPGKCSLYPWATSPPLWVYFQFWGRILPSYLGWPWTCSITQASIEFLSFSLSLPRSWDYKPIPDWPMFFKINSIKYKIQGPGEMTQQLRVCITLPGDPNSIHSTHSRCSNLPAIPAPGIRYSWLQWAPMYVEYTPSHMHMHRHKIKNKLDLCSKISFEILFFFCAGPCAC